MANDTGNNGTANGSANNGTADRFVEGTYKAKVQSWHFSTAKDSRFFKITMNFKFTEGPNTGKILRFGAGGSEKSRDLVKRVLFAVGWDGRALTKDTVFTKEAYCVVVKKMIPKKDDDGNEMTNDLGEVVLTPVWDIQYVNDLDGPTQDKFEVPEEKVEEVRNAFNMFLGASDDAPVKPTKAKPAARSGSPEGKSGGESAGGVETGDDDSIPF